MKIAETLLLIVSLSS